MRNYGYLKVYRRPLRRLHIHFRPMPRKGWRTARLPWMRQPHFSQLPRSDQDAAAHK